MAGRQGRVTGEVENNESGDGNTDGGLHPEEEVDVVRSLLPAGLHDDGALGVLATITGQFQVGAEIKISVRPNIWRMSAGVKAIEMKIIT